MLRAFFLALLCGCASAPQVVRPDTVARLGTRTFEAPRPRVWAALRDVLEEAERGDVLGPLTSAVRGDALNWRLQSAPRAEPVVLDGATVTAARSEVWTLEALSERSTRVTATPRLVLGERDLSQQPLFELRREERAWAEHFRALEAALALREVACRSFDGPPERARVALVSALKAARHFVTAEDPAGGRLHTSRRILVGAGGYSAFSREYDAQLSADGEGTAVCLLPTLILLSAGEVTVPRVQLDLATEARISNAIFKELAEALDKPQAPGASTPGP